MLVAPPGEGARVHGRAGRDRQDPRDHAEGRRRSAWPDRLHVLAARHRQGMDAGAGRRPSTAWFAKASKWRGGSTFAGHVNQIFDATVDAFTDGREAGGLQGRAALRAAHARRNRAAAAVRRGGGGGGGRGDAAPPAAGGAPPPAARRRRRAAGSAGRRRLRAARRRRRAAVAAGAAARRRLAPGSARSPGALRQPRVPARRRPGLARRTRRRPERRRPARRCSRGSCASCHKFGTVGATLRARSDDDRPTMPRRDILRVDLLPAREGRSRSTRTTVIATADKQDDARPGRQRGRAERQCSRPQTTPTSSQSARC